MKQLNKNVVTQITTGNLSKKAPSLRRGVANLLSVVPNQ